jgi:hypothetical protein
MALKIACRLKLLRQTDRACLFYSERHGKVWIPSSAIVDLRRQGDDYTLVVHDWLPAASAFDDVTLSELLSDKPPADIRLTTGIHEKDFPEDLKEVQQQAVDYAIRLRRCLIWLWTGSGKTKIGIELANLLFRHGRIHRLWWITPQLERIQSQLTEAFSRWLIPQIDLRLQSIHHYSFNTNDDIGQMDCVIIDECHRIKNGIILVNELPECRLAYNIRLSTQRAGYIYGLTATSCINGPLDLFGIFFAMDSSIIIEPGRRAHHYLHRHGERITGIKNMLTFIQRISPYIFHRRRIDYDSRRVLHRDMPLLLTADQVEAMKQLYRRISPVTDESIVDTFCRMVQCCYRCGGYHLKKRALVDLIHEIDRMFPDEQIIIFGYTVQGRLSDLSIIREAVRQSGLTMLELHGMMSDEDNRLSIHRFRQRLSRILIATYGCGAESLDFPNASHVILFGHSLNPLHRFQAVGRIDRINQTRQCYSYNIFVRNSVEGYVNQLYERKVEMSDDISFYMKQPGALTNEIY